MKKELTIGKCRGCKKLWDKESLTSINISEPSGDGFIIQKTYLCKGCVSYLHEGIKDAVERRKAEEKMKGGREYE